LLIALNKTLTLKTTNNSNGILLLYRHPLKANAPALKTHIESFSKYSKHDIWSINTKLGFPASIDRIEFSAVILHYSVFPIAIDEKFQDFLHYLKLRASLPKIAFFQDEHALCKERFKFINDVGVDVIYTLLEHSEHSKVYLANTDCKIIKHTLTGYVDDSLINAGRKLSLPDNKRTIDIGYRARELPYYMGKGGLEKTMIAKEFLRHSRPTSLITNIETGEKSRFNGDSWYRFIAKCKAMLGVEAGVSIFDIDGNAHKECDKYLLENPKASFNEVHNAVLTDYEDKIYYRTLSPRIFECAALRTCMILFEGRYNDILKPMIHYIPLKKDFSNFQDVINIFSDAKERMRLSNNAYKDLIASDKYSYKNFIRDFDKQLEKMNITPQTNKAKLKQISAMLKRDEMALKFKIKKNRILKNFSR